MSINKIFKWLLAIVFFLIILFASMVIYFIFDDVFKIIETYSEEKTNLASNNQDNTQTQPIENYVNREVDSSSNGVIKPKVKINKNPIKNPSALDFKLIIPKINVDGIVDAVGLTKDGAMEAPIGPRGLGWYKFGPYPGEEGSAVIDGHYGRWVSGEGSIFDDLDKLKKGDTIYIEKDTGEIITFIVRELKIYQPEDDASDVFFSSDGETRLNLITCAGKWNGKEKTFSERLVVFADKN